MYRNSKNLDSLNPTTLVHNPQMINNLCIQIAILCRVTCELAKYFVGKVIIEMQTYCRVLSKYGATCLLRRQLSFVKVDV